MGVLQVIVFSSEPSTLHHICMHMCACGVIVHLHGQAVYDAMQGGPLWASQVN